MASSRLSNRYSRRPRLPCLSQGGYRQIRRQCITHRNNIHGSASFESFVASSSITKIDAFTGTAAC